MADQISDVSVSLCTSSKYVTPFRLHYKQDGVEKNWDYIKGHDSIAILLYNKDRDVFPVVKQFRPAVYAAKIKAFTDGQTVDTEKHRGEEGMTLELCAGIMDKDKDVAEMAQAEVLEETGYKVPLQNLKKITSFRCGVGTEGSKQHLFYAEVTDQMKVSSGGGLVEEGEMIEVIELSGRDAMKCIMDEAITKPVGMMFAFQWNGVGVKGTLMTLFYAEVTDQMKVTSGGGLVDEGEQIEVVELSGRDAMKCMMDESITKPVWTMFAFQWFYFMKDNA